MHLLVSRDDNFINVCEFLNHFHDVFLGSVVRNVHQVDPPLEQQKVLPRRFLIFLGPRIERNDLVDLVIYCEIVEHINTFLS